MVESSKRWLVARGDGVLNERFRFEGDRLSRPPRGYAKDHPLIEDLKWKDFTALAGLSRDEVIGNKLLPRVVDDFAAGAPLMRFLCEALEVRY